MEGDWHHRALRGDLPSPHQAMAARTTAQLIPASGTAMATLRSSYRSTATGGTFGLRSLIDGESLLLAARLVEEADGRITPLPALVSLRDADESDWFRAIVECLIESARPMWVAIAAGHGDVDWTLVPDHARSALDALPPDEREALLLALAWRFTETERQRVGGLAEEHVVDCMQTLLNAAGRPDLADGVCRVSLISDALGYDVTAPRLDGGVLRLEVKGTRASGAEYVIYLSRNEAEVGLRDPAWRLVVCSVHPDDRVRTKGWLTGAEVAPLLPQDQSAHAAWHSVEIFLSDAVLHPGDPAIA